MTDESLPLFVYGTLRPGGSGWPLIASRVVRILPAAAPGRCVDAGTWYPTAVFSAGAGPLEGDLLWLDPACFPETLRQIDDYEDVPYLFRRVVVEVETDGRRVRAWAYEWRGPRAP